MVSWRLPTLLIKLIIIQVLGYHDPKEETSLSEVFEFRDHDYVFTTTQTTWKEASVICKYQLNGTLVTFEKREDHGEYKFVVSAMSQSNLDLDALWIGFRKKDGVFKWEGTDVTVPDENITCSQNTLENAEQTCGVFVRQNHVTPCLAKLSCTARRGYICKKAVNDTSTHSGWVRMGDRLYKIFSTRMTYDHAMRACMRHDKEARLAVVINFEHVTALGRMLTVGRPKLENAWIGARWVNFEPYSRSYYVFESESLYLSPITDTKNWPPWLNKKVVEHDGCIVLDRHVKNMTTFVETSCNRSRGYICYKLVKGTPVDVCTLGNYDWRIYYEPKTWQEASKTCNKLATGRLPYLRKMDLNYFIRLMESGRRGLSHLWLGARYTAHKWIWIWNNETIPTEIKDGYPPWVANNTFDEEIEQHNLCLNIDRENSVQTFFYGTVCDYPQPFICQYDKLRGCLEGHLYLPDELKYAQNYSSTQPHTQPQTQPQTQPSTIKSI